MELIMNDVRRGRRLKRRSAYGRRSYRNAGNSNTFFKFGLLLIAVLFAFALKYVDQPPISTFKEFVAENIGGNETIKDTVAVIGRAVTGEDGLWGKLNNAAVKVFNPSSVDKTSEADGQNPTKTAENPESLPTISPNVFDEISPESTGDTLSAGAFSAQELVFKRADELKEIGAESFAKYGYGLAETELPDGVKLLLKETVPQKIVPQIVPLPKSPEVPALPYNVDGKIYKLPFTYAAPLKGPVTSAFGARNDPLNGEGAFHHGVDIGVNKGTTIKCFAAGKVIEVGTNSVYGRYVRVQHSGGYTSFYAHCTKISVKNGQTVKLGQKIATSGSTGRVTGPHLHFELRRNDLLINPSNYVKFS